MIPAPDENLSLLEGGNDSYSVHLDTFEGPLDLLLHLIKKNELDIFDIPIAVITRQYLDYINLMKELNLEIAGDFLLMATTLLHIKSRTLLPRDEEEAGEDDEQDPKAELIRRLLEYQRYKEAGQVIGARALLGREVFASASPESEVLAAQVEDGPLELTLFDLVEAFRNLLDRIPKESFHQVAPADNFSIADCINEILALLQERESIQFDELVSVDLTREKVIASFLALLELCRLKLIRIFQNSPHAPIWFVPAVTAKDP